MRLLLYAAFALILDICAPTHAFAEAKIPSPPNTPEQQGSVRTAGAAYLPTAKLFGRDTFAYGTYTSGSHIVLEYAPAGDDVKKWTRLVTVIVIPLLKDTPDEMENLIIQLRSGLRSHGKILYEEPILNNVDSPSLFVEHEFGEGKSKEHSAATLLRIRPHIAAYIQAQTRGIPVDPFDFANMKLFAEGKLKPPQ